MKHCVRFEEFISAYVDGELDSADELLLEEHLRSCPSCVNLLALYHGMSVSLRESCLEVPGFLRDNVMSAIKNPDATGIVTPVYPDEIDEEFEIRAKRRKLMRTVLTRYAPIAACLAIALLVLPQFFNIDRRAANEMADIAPVGALPEMAYADADAVMGFGEDGEDIEMFAWEELDDAGLAPIAPAGQADEPTDWGGIPTNEAYDTRGGVPLPIDDPQNLPLPPGVWTMNDSLLEPEYVATAGYYAFIMVEHEFSDSFTFITYYGDYNLLEQADVAAFIQQYEEFIVFFIPGDETAEFALVQFVI